ncbi:melatonin receptor type 1A-like [Mytilus californianus]|uniref:melatonin receptor type 1A-like n=1 Tax=Mytilus californianus TaxID=6549 RepID=UPI002247B189|nr:melatonin receptor type 1A-like [Mytilus californianus]
MNTTFNTSGYVLKYFGKYEFIQESPGLAITCIVLQTIASVVGTFGNALILIITARSKGTMTMQSIFIINIAISDMYVTLMANPMSIVGKVEGRTFFLQYPILCEIIGKMCTISCIVSLGSITFLSFNRYILICYNSYYEKIFTRTSCIIMCISLYFLGIIMVLLNYAGIGGHGFDDKSLECIWDRKATYSFTVFFSVCLVWIPLIVVGVSYFKLFLFVRHKRKQVTSRNSAPNIDNKSLRLAKAIFIVYAVFSICWIPFAILLVADTDDTFPHEVHLGITVFAHFHPSFNFFIYYFSNRKFKTEFHKIFHIVNKENSQVSLSSVTKINMKSSLSNMKSFSTNMKSSSSNMKLSSSNLFPSASNIKLSSSNLFPSSS